MIGLQVFVYDQKSPVISVNLRMILIVHITCQFWQREAAVLRQQLQILQENHRYILLMTMTCLCMRTMGNTLCELHS